MPTESITETLDTSTLLKTLIAFRDGDFSVRLPVDQTGSGGKDRGHAQRDLQVE